MKKKISVLLCVLVAMLCFTACGSKKENLQYDKSTITQATDFLIEYCNSADADTIEQWNKMTDFQIESQLNQAGVPFTKDSFLAALDAWQQGTKECGEYVSHGDYKFEPSSDELKVTTSAKFKDRDADITFVFDEDLYLDSTTIDAHYSIGEIMEKAGLNTILGMGTVFVILIFISILISLFKYIPALEEKFKNKGKAESTQEAAPAPAAAPAGAGEAVEAPMPGKVIRINKHVGDAVAAGDEVLVLEAMKMGNPIMAPCDGKITSMQAQEGQSVQGGDPLFTVGY